MTKKLQKTYIEISQLGVFQVLRKENEKEAETYYFNPDLFERFLLIYHSQSQTDVIKEETKETIIYTLLNPIQNRKFELEKNNDDALITILKKEWNIREIDKKEYEIIIKRKIENQRKRYNKKVNDLYFEVFELLPSINKMFYHPKYSIEELENSKKSINEIASNIARLELTKRI